MTAFMMVRVFDNGSELNLLLLLRMLLKKVLVDVQERLRGVVLLWLLLLL